MRSKTITLIFTQICDQVLSLLLLIFFSGRLFLLTFLISTSATAISETKDIVKVSSNLDTKNYEFIFFYSSTCYHCQKFSPILKQYADSTKIPIHAFTTNGSRSRYFPNSSLTSQEIIEQFFGFSDDYDQYTKISVPALFILNKNTLHAYPVSYGELTSDELSLRMQILLLKIMQYEKN